ncbi:MAG: DNA repair protein RadC [Bacteroidetes bacterium]|nr:DNA repair protein RadC [Bacteroidota bacterium]
MSEKTFFPISSWADDDKPREKLLLKGKTALSDAELLAIIIGSGSKNESAVALSQRILASVSHNLNTLGKLSILQLVAFKGMGDAKAVAVQAALELGKRRRAAELPQWQTISSSMSVFELMQPVIGELSHEEFWILYLNNAHKIMLKAQLSKGGITGTLVDVRLVYKTALELGAVGIILAHNHPSGTLRPSESDRQITKKLKMAGEQLDIKVLDHLIITEHGYFSFADEGML